jgi:hypothetical protein
MTSKSDKKRKPSSVRHTRAVQFDRLKQPIADNLPDHVKKLFAELVHPLTMAQSQLFHKMGLRERTLTLPVMMSIFLMAIWEMPQNVSQQAISALLTRLPSKLVLNILNELLPLMQERWKKRSRPMPPEVTWVLERYKQCLLVDGSTLDALIRKIGLLREEEKNPLAGKMTALLHLGSHLPHQIWFNPKATAQDQTFWELILNVVVKNSLLIFDLGYTNFAHFNTLTQKGATFITRAKSNLKYERIKTFAKTATFRDTLVWIGSDETQQQVRLIEVFYKNKWHRYLTNELDPNHLPARHCVSLYHRRWSIERAFFVVKRLLGLAYFWSGAQNAVEFQLWSVWIVYSILIDLSDEVAELLDLPFESLSVEMTYRSMYYYVKAVERGESDSFPHFLQQNAKHLGIVKRKRKKNISIYTSWPLTTGVLA